MCWTLSKGWRLRFLLQRKTEGTILSQEGVGNCLQLKCISGWKDIHPEILADILLWVGVQEDTNKTFPDQNLRQKCRKRLLELPLLGQQSKWSKYSNYARFSTVSIPCYNKLCYFRVQSATMRELDDDDSVESLKAKNQKVRKRF